MSLKINILITETREIIIKIVVFLIKVIKNLYLHSFPQGAVFILHAQVMQSGSRKVWNI